MQERIIMLGLCPGGIILPVIPPTQQATRGVSHSAVRRTMIFGRCAWNMRTSGEKSHAHHHTLKKVIPSCDRSCYVCKFDQPEDSQTDDRMITRTLRDPERICI